MSGTAAIMEKSLHKYIDKRHQQFGHIFREKLGTQEAVFVSSANLMRSVFLYEGQYPTHPLPDSWVLYNKLHNCKRGLFFMDGSEWHTNRKILNRLLLNGNLNWLNLHIEYCTRKLIDEWRNAAKNIKGYFMIDDLEGQLYRWAIDVVCSVMFGYKADNISDSKLTTAIDAFSKNVHKIFINSANLMNFPPKLARTLRMKIWTQFENDVTEVLKMGYEIIDMQINQECDGAACEDGLFVKMRLAGMPMEDIKRIFVDLIIAAGDTTAFSSQWALYLLSQNSDIQDKIHCEEFTTSSEISVLRGFIRETLRLYPVAPFIGRFLNTDAVIGDYEVKKNSMVILSLYTSGRDPEHFPNPLDVQPERWFRNSDTGELRNVLQAHGTIPFGVGSRSCIGKKLALHQMHSLVSEVTRNFNIKCFNTKPIDVILRLVAVPNETLQLGVKLLET
ncbi:cytochrome P450 315a1, mitochondrial isoform X2 [Episyrphus balteatus]|uniref:cytochrome P450 315a1, mitochondrial isoform X2 n=1 Tax=Episyrphus balteatus TaxID=286459 RepID=UPI002485EA61|nr:cytochrome P450 315a1, mitochondrial isoform X2 [Episyrphus balteatus]